MHTHFDGPAVAAADVLVRYTHYGDADLNGVVDGADHARIDAGYAGHLTGWANGDVNLGGTVDGSDYTRIDDAFNEQAGRLGGAPSTVAVDTDEVAAVPEPAGPLARVAVGLLGRRRIGRAVRPQACGRRSSRGRTTRRRATEIVRPRGVGDECERASAEAIRPGGRADRTARGVAEPVKASRADVRHRRFRRPSV